MLKRCVFLLIVLGGLPPAGAQADWLFTPALGTTFGADSFGRENPMFGAAIAWVDEEAFGWEIDLGYAPEFFDGADGAGVVNGGSVMSVMGNALVGFPVGSGAFRPYLTGGLGLMQMRVVSDSGLFESSTAEFGYNLGGGAMAFFGSRFGLRGDLRYIRSFQNQAPSWTRGVDIDVAPGNFDFLRASAGVTFRFGED